MKETIAFENRRTTQGRRVCETAAGSGSGGKGAKGAGDHANGRRNVFNDDFVRGFQRQRVHPCRATTIYYSPLVGNPVHSPRCI